MDQAPGRKVDCKAGKTAADARQESGFRAAPSAGLRYRFARALATRINAPTFRQSPIISGLFSLAGQTSFRMTETRILVLIPARMAATRLPGKPLLDIGGLPMIVHVLRRAEEADIGRVAVATDTPEIAAAVRAAGGEVVMTRADHPSGSDRIHEALRTIDPDGRGRDRGQSAGRFSDDRAGHHPGRAAAARRPRRRYRDAGRADPHRGRETNPNVVKAVGSPIGPRRLRALYFTRATAPHGDGPRYHHIGLYAYRRAALERSWRCRRRRWSSRRSSSNCGRWRPACGSTSPSSTRVPRGVDTPADLETARQILAKSLTG